MFKKDSQINPEKVRPLIVKQSNQEEDQIHFIEYVGQNLKKLRQEKSLSLENLARLSNVSRTMLTQIESARSVPTINVLWKIAKALNVPFSGLISIPSEDENILIRKENAKILTSDNGKFSSKALFPYEKNRSVEFYEIRLLPQAIENAYPHPLGTTENLVVNAGKLSLTGGAEHFSLKEGDSIFFKADVPHSYHNPGSITTQCFLVMTYEDILV